MLRRRTVSPSCWAPTLLEAATYLEEDLSGGAVCSLSEEGWLEVRHLSPQLHTFQGVALTLEEAMLSPACQGQQDMSVLSHFKPK